MEAGLGGVTGAPATQGIAVCGIFSTAAGRVATPCLLTEASLAQGEEKISKRAHRLTVKASLFKQTNHIHSSNI